MVKVSCKLFIEKLQNEAELRKRVLIRKLLKDNIKKGIVVADEEYERLNIIDKLPNHMIRLQLKVTDDDA